MKNYHSVFEHEKYYHIYNRGNNGETIFMNNNNYQFFLSKWIRYINPWAKALAYCLMPNHFHFLIKIIPEEGFTKLLKFGKAERSEAPAGKSFTNPLRLSKAELPDINSFVENQFKRLFSSYALAFNKQQNRHGSLFEKRFKRVLISSDAYFSKIIHYIHNNPIHHHFRSDYTSWRFSSYNSFISNKPSLLHREEVLQWFGGVEAFVEFHRSEINYNEITDVTLDLKQQVFY